MRSARNPFLLLTLLFLVTVLSQAVPAPPALASTIPAMPSNYVVDLAGIMDQSSQSTLNGFLRELEQKTGAQVVLLSVDSLEGNSLEDFSLAVAEKWGLGQRGRDNGLLILFAMKERKYRFEVGYGLEGILPDSLVGSIGRQYIVPYFRKGEYANGAAAATLAVAGIIAGEKGVTITGMPSLGRPGTGTRAERKRSLSEKVFLILIFFLFIYMLIRHPRMLFMFLLLSSMGGRRSSWGGGSGFGGGGFGGGGGGGFGGGGASGGW